ncbi:MAG TPA: type II toxin-antitoxin system death-on-curing family toxin [Longimicrobiales bacterium]|nr:type II toxin-antitoxin system death-on-curing family toxin [Longimicrobiales bacterium]
MSRKEPRWVPRLVVEAIHVDQVREHGGLLGIRDGHALESALARAKQRGSYDVGVDLPRLAADYAFGISSNHPFEDGNKRVAFVTAVTFLGLNGLEFHGTDEEVVATMLTLASGKMNEEKPAQWFRERTKKRRHR